jgi:dihydroorotate dehydrogenase
MHSEIKLKDLLLQMKTNTGSSFRLATKIGVTERTVRTWLGKTEDELHRLHYDNIELIVSTARDKLGIEPGMFSPPPLLWDFQKSYGENIGLDPGIPPRLSAPFRNHSIPFLGYSLNSRFGASASVITSTSQRIRFLFESHVDVVTYKTVRSDSYKSHPWPNIFFCAEDAPLLKPEGGMPLVRVGESPENFRPSFGMMNRFGMPSPPREVWQADFRAAQALAKRGQLLILSVVGTANRNDAEAVLIKDFVKVVEYALAAGADVIEINLSCPNCSGMEGELYRNVALVERICKAIRTVIGNAKILLKIGYLRDTDLHDFVERTAPYVHGYSAINTVPIEGYREGQNGPEPAYGKPKLKAGLSGPPIFRCGLSCVQGLARIRSELKINNIGIIGIGGAMTPPDVQRYIDSGADVVQCTSALFVDSLFGIRVRTFLDSQLASTLKTADEERDIARMNWSRAVSSLESDFGGDDAVWSSVQMVALQDFLEWERAQKTAIALGPRRALPVPTIDEFKDRIKNRLGPS